MHISVHYSISQCQNTDLKSDRQKFCINRFSEISNLILKIFIKFKHLVYCEKWENVCFALVFVCPSLYRKFFRHFSDKIFDICIHCIKNLLPELKNHFSTIFVSNLWMRILLCIIHELCNVLLNEFSS